jgi:CubicO group peptidase (beta-lactamase class C family)
MIAELNGFSTERLDRLSGLLKGYVDRNNLPCVSALVGRWGKTIYREKFGWQDIQAQKPVAFETIFRIMSMSKPVTAVAAMLLYEEGHFDLNTPIHRFLPAFENPKVLISRDAETGEVKTEEAASPITFRHLFTHTSGISYGGSPDDPVDHLYRQVLHDPAKSPSLDTLPGFIEHLATLPLACQPGTQWRYGFSLDVLAALVEVISGMSFPDFLKARLFEPLGMHDTGFTVPEDKLNRLATLYRQGPAEGTLVPREAPVPMPVMMWGGGGLVSTLDDYSRFAAMLAQGGIHDGTRLLSPTTTRMFSMNWADPAALPSFVAANPPVNGGYGLSLGTAVLLDPSPTGKFGNPGEFYWGGAFGTYFWIDPQESLYGVLMTQLDPNWAYPIPWQFKQMVYQTRTD